MIVFLRVLAIAFLAMVLGGASVYFGFFPGKLLRDGFTGLQASLLQSEQLASTYNKGAIFLADSDEVGVVRHAAAKTDDGFTVFTTALGDEVRLIDMEGRVRKTWTVSYTDLWDANDEVQDLVPPRFIFLRKARVYPDGRLLVMFAAWATTPHGYGIAMIDKDSSLLWKQFRHLHHSFDEGEDGRIYVLDHQIVAETNPGAPNVIPPFIEDGITIFRANGEFESRFSLLDSFIDSEYREVIPQIIVPSSIRSVGGAAAGLGNLLHANDVEILRENLADKFSIANPGDLMVSFRELHAIAIIDADSKKVKWFKRGDWFEQHDPDFLDNGNILLFDNIDMREDPNRERASRVVEINPENMAEEWVFRGNKDMRFRTTARGSQQRLPNGNTLITESHRGRLLEISRDGEVVWEYVHDQRLGDNDELIPVIMWAERYTQDQLQFELDN